MVIRSSSPHGARVHSSVTGAASQDSEEASSPFSLEYAPESRQQQRRRQVQWRRGRKDSSDESAADSVDIVDVDGINPELIELMSRHARLEIPVIIQRRKQPPAAPAADLDLDLDPPVDPPAGVHDAAGPRGRASVNGRIVSSSSSSRRTSANAPSARPRSGSLGGGGGVASDSAGGARDLSADRSCLLAQGQVPSGKATDRSPERMMGKGRDERLKQLRPWAPPGGGGAVCAEQGGDACKETKVGVGIAPGWSRKHNREVGMWISCIRVKGLGRSFDARAWRWFRRLGELRGRFG